MIDMFDCTILYILHMSKCCLSLFTNFQIQEELLAAKSNYEALNSHLLDELPTLNSLAYEVLVECLAAFVMARKTLSGKITREYFALMEVRSFSSNRLCKRLRWSRGSVLAFGTQVRGFKPGRSCRIF